MLLNTQLRNEFATYAKTLGKDPSPLLITSKTGKRLYPKLSATADQLREPDQLR